MNAKSDLPKSVQKKLKNKSYQVRYTSETDKYSKTRYEHIYRGYDAFQNICVVRPYIQAKYDIDQSGLEMLLYLEGLKLFDYVQYRRCPKRFHWNRWFALEKHGLVSVVMDADKGKDRVFTLSKKARKIVIDFYECLSGEQKIPEDSKFNPMVESDKAFIQKKMNLIKRINKIPPKEHIKTLFED